MIFPKYKGTGYVARKRPQAGMEQESSNQSYETPYQWLKQGLLVTLAISTTYDSDATPTSVVAVPAITGARPDGWTEITTLEPDPRPGVAGKFLPYTAKLTATDGNNIAYCPDYLEWPPVTVAPMIAGTIIGIPLAAGVTLVVGDEVAASNGGYAKKATSGNTVVGKVEIAADNSTGANGAAVATVKLVQMYTK